MEFSEELNEIAREYASKYPGDIEKAKELGFAKLRKHPDFERWVNDMAYKAFCTYIYRHRKIRNSDISRRGTTKPTPNNEPVVFDEHASETLTEYLEYGVCGRTIGDLKFSELPSFAHRNSELSTTHAFWADLSRSLYDLRPSDGDPSVREVVTEKQMAALYHSVLRKQKGPLPKKLAKTLQPASSVAVK